MSRKQTISRVPLTKEDNHDEEEAIVLRAKIDKLLSSTVTTGRRDDGGDLLALPTERALVSLVLLTRLDSSHASGALIHHPKLAEVCRAIVLSCSSNDGDKEATNTASSSVVYLRLVAQVIAAACSASTADQERAKDDDPQVSPGARVRLWEQLGCLMLELVAATATISPPHLTALDADVTMALAAILPRCVDATLLDSLLIHAWNRVSAVLRHEREAVGVDGREDFDAVAAPIRDATAHHNSDTAADRETGGGRDDPISPEVLLEMTLAAILEQNSWWNHGEGGDERRRRDNNLHWWEVQVGAVFAEHGYRAVASVSDPSKRKTVARPSFFVPMLDWWLERKRSAKCDATEERSPLALSDAASSYASSPTQWAQVLLLCLQRCANDDDYSGGGGFQDLASDAEISGKIIHLFLACMVSATPDDNLRGQAWFTLSSLIVAQGTPSGWHWMLAEPPVAVPASSPGRRTSRSSRYGLGRASKLCALLRMASGEYKIQLNHRLYGAHQAPTVTAVDTAELCLQQDRSNLVDGCGRFLTLSLDFVAGLADRAEFDVENENDDRTLLLSDGAIMHVRKSLREALTCTAHYCSELTRFDDANVVDLTVVRLFGALLSEFDIFLDRRQDENDDEHAILAALRVVLNVVRNREASEGLLPGLLMIFASSEGDESRALVLKSYLSDLVGFFEFWWNSTSCQVQEDWSSANVSMIECSWSVLQLWHDMVVQTGVAVEVGGIQREIVKCLSLLQDRTHDDQNEAKRSVRAIASALSSYFALQGDEAPGEPDASIIRHTVGILKQLAS